MKNILKKLIILGIVAVFPLSFCIKSEALTIVLDPGHGGIASGCTHNYNGKIIKEKQLNSKIASFIQQELKKYKTKSGENINVYLTRTNINQNPSLEQRVDFGVKKNANLIVSLHNNASFDGSKKYRGSMVLVTNSNFNNLYNIEESISKNILEELNKIGVPICSDDSIGGQSKNCAGLLRRLSINGAVYPNGDTTDYYGIIRYGVLKNIPSILIEHAYLDNEEDYRNFLCSDNKLQGLAIADVKGIAKYYGLVHKN